MLNPPQDDDIIYVIILVAPEAHLAFILELPEPPAGAVEQRLAGLPFAELREQGRWRSVRALRTYLDVANSLYLSQSMSRHASAAAWMEENFGQCFPWWQA